MKDVASFRIHYTQFLDPAGAPAGSLPDFAHEPAVLIDLYRSMVAARQFDKKAIAMQRTGQLGTYASCLGQEAIGAGIGHAMR
ncbi:MAG: pyruvate dehydrogenase (acetyl-transferring) E1 component subunit alpha, partial [Gammaproteobacteria bacterium]